MARNITTTATDAAQTLIVVGGGAASHIAVNNIGSYTAYLGGIGVTSSNGYPIGPSDDITMPLGERESIYAICATGQTTTLRSLVMGA